MAYQYTNKNGETFGITHTENSTIAYINGSYVAQAETEKGTGRSSQSLFTRRY